MADRQLHSFLPGARRDIINIVNAYLDRADAPFGFLSVVIEEEAGLRFTGRRGWPYLFTIGTWLCAAAATSSDAELVGEILGLPPSDARGLLAYGWELVDRSFKAGPSLGRSGVVLEELIVDAWRRVGLVRAATNVDEWWSSLVGLECYLSFVMHVAKGCLDPLPPALAAILDQLEELRADVSVLEEMTLAPSLDFGFDMHRGIAEDLRRHLGDPVPADRRFRRERLLIPAQFLEKAPDDAWRTPGPRLARLFACLADEEPRRAAVAVPRRAGNGRAGAG